MIPKTIILVVLVTLTSVASANPFYVGRFGGLKAGPLTQSAFATYWNPASCHPSAANLGW